ncbi:MAG: DUF86 domain-containing protein [Candidatus Rokubacteria bacterium]|nr:DUF86 domain-containing protein [Candidatus Rokubacteria bacterium]
MIDRELIIRKLALITGDLAELRAVAQRPREEYLASVRDELVAERLLERMIGRMIDINYHLIVERGHPPPADYYESFVRLGTLQVLLPDFARHLASCAGLRNRIVHEYDDIDAARVYEALQAAVKDIPEYVRYIQQHVEATGTT